MIRLTDREKMGARDRAHAVWIGSVTRVIVPDPQSKEVPPVPVPAFLVARSRG